MKFKGAYSGETSYNVGDVVIFEQDNKVYHLQNPAKSGTSPHDTLYWGMVDQSLADAVVLMADVLQMSQGASGGGGVFVMHETVVEGTATLDANYNQVSAAIEAGQLPVVLKEKLGGGVDILYVVSAFGNNDTGYGISTTGRMTYAAASATDPLTEAEPPSA